MFSCHRTIFFRGFVFWVSLISFQEESFALSGQSGIDQSFKYAGVVLAFANNSTGEKCSGILMDGNRILTARHCWSEGKSLYVAHDSDSGWSENATVSFPKLCGENCKLGNDILRINIGMPAGKKIRIKTFRKRTDVLKYLKDSIAAHREAHSWGDMSGLQMGKILAIHEKEHILELEISVIIGDSGGPVWIGDKLIGLICGYRADSGNMLVSIFAEELF